MSSESWDEIKRLAADFQRAQLSSTSQKLSERNCIEIVKILQDLNLVDLIYTQDGKEYLTHQELGKEIKEELMALGGRVNLVDLQIALNVDLSHIEAKVSEIIGSEPDLMLILGQLIDRSYLDVIADEINDKLQLKGRITIAELTKDYDLPGDFINTAIRQRLGTIIIGQADSEDPRLYYTQAFFARHESIVFGALSGCVRPIQLSCIKSRYDLQPNLIMSIANSLISSKQIKGILTGGITGQFVPNVFTLAQQRWVNDFFAQNEYLEYDAVKRLGIVDAPSYVKKQFKNKGAECIFMPTCVISSKYNDIVEIEIDEILSGETWSDVSTVLPSILSDEDIGFILSDRIKAKLQILSGNKKNSSLPLQYHNIYVVCSDLLEQCAKTFDDIINVKAEEEAKNKPSNKISEKQTMKEIAAQAGGVISKEDKKEQRRKKATGGSKTQGSNTREIKMKSTKKKGRSNKNDEVYDDLETEEECFMTTSELVDHMQSVSQGDIELTTKPDESDNSSIIDKLSECPVELLACIASGIQKRLQEKFTEVAKSVHLQTLASSAASSGGNKQKSHSTVSEEISTLWKNANLFTKSISLLGDDNEVVLNRHLLRTICSEITNIVFVELAGDHIIYNGDDLSTVTPEMRSKALSKLTDQDMRQALMKLHTTVNGKSVEEFMKCLEVLCGVEYLSVMLKKNDKKKEKQLLLSFREDMKENLTKEENLPNILHMSLVLLIIHHFDMVIHAPGKCVPQMLNLLRGKVSNEDYGDLLECQGLVMKTLREPTEDISSEVEIISTKVKALAVSPKKN